MTTGDQALLRLEIFHDLELFIDSRGGFASRDELTTFTLRSGRPMPVIDRNKGIRNPRELDATLSIVSASDKGRYNVYDDAIDRDRGLLFYSWAQGPLEAGDNRKLLVALEQQVPIILFGKPLANVYVPVIGVRVIDVLPDRRQFVIDLDDTTVRTSPTATLDKRYVERLVKQRVHQPVFRVRALSAYAKRCAVCTLRYAELLDAAHILPDTDERGLPVVTKVWRCARSTTRRTTRTSSASAPTTSCTSTSGCSRIAMGRCCSTGCRRWTAGRSSCRAGVMSGPIATSSPRGSPRSAHNVSALACRRARPHHEATSPRPTRRPRRTPDPPRNTR